MKRLEEHLFWIETNSQPSLKYMETELCHKLWPWSSFVKAYQICTWTLVYTDSRKDAWPGSGASNRHI